MGSPQRSSTGSGKVDVATPSAGPGSGERYYIQLFFPDPKDKVKKESRWLGSDDGYNAILVEKQEKAARVQKFEYDGKTYYKLLDTEGTEDYYLSHQAARALFMKCLWAVSWHFDKDKHLCVDVEGCSPAVNYVLAKDFQSNFVYCVGEDSLIISDRPNFEFLTAKLCSASSGT
jgi:hypothetical protein